MVGLEGRCRNKVWERTGRVGLGGKGGPDRGPLYYLTPPFPLFPTPYCVIFLQGQPCGFSRSTIWFCQGQPRAKVVPFYYRSKKHVTHLSISRSFLSNSLFHYITFFLGLPRDGVSAHFKTLTESEKKTVKIQNIINWSNLRIPAKFHVDLNSKLSVPMVKGPYPRKMFLILPH
jgi:hypothetical protein